MKKLLALALTLALTLSAAPALAAGEESFPAVNTYPGFTDVGADAWFLSGVKTCYEVGLMNGKGAAFAPDAPMQICESAAIAARMHDRLNGGDGIVENSPGATEWYVGVMQYMHRLATSAKDTLLLSRLSSPTAPATRSDFFSLLALVVPDTLLTPINKVTALPDSKSEAVLAYYNAGILQGVGEYGMFLGSKGLKRSEAATMVARTVRPAQRLTFTLKPADLVTLTTGLSPETPFFTVGNQIIRADTYCTHLMNVLDSVAAASAHQGLDFSWDLTVDGTPLKEYSAQAAKELALAGAVQVPDATEAFQAFDPQVFYSKVLDLRAAQGQ